MSFHVRLSPQQAALYRSIPKVYLHRHLEGSPRLETMQVVIREHEITMPMTRGLSALKERILAASQAAFLPDSERRRLVESLRLQLNA
jgi:adenosine deaminase